MSDQLIAEAVRLRRSPMLRGYFKHLRFWELEDCFGWSPEKYRKVAQRGRKRLAALCGVS